MFSHSVSHFSTQHVIVNVHWIVASCMIWKQCMISNTYRTTLRGFMDFANTIQGWVDGVGQLGFVFYVSMHTCRVSRNVFLSSCGKLDDFSWQENRGHCRAVLPSVGCAHKTNSISHWIIVPVQQKMSYCICLQLSCANTLKCPCVDIRAHWNLWCDTKWIFNAWTELRRNVPGKRAMWGCLC